jgi:phage-related protein
LEALGIVEPIFDILNAFVSLLGVAFMPIVTQIIQLLIPFLPTMQQLGLALQPFVTLLVNMLTPLGLLNIALPYVNIALVGLTNALNAVNWENVQNWFSNLPSQILGWIESGIYAIRDWFVGLPNRIADWIEESADAIINAIKKLFGL